jgi:large subunit ribosomal protein L18
MKIAKKTRKKSRKRLHLRVRKKVAGSTERPRLCVCFTGKHIHAQIIDDAAGKTLAAASSTEKALEKARANVSGAIQIGKTLAERAKAKKITEVVFDRGGFKYHGKVKALADAAREAGLVF